MPRALRRLPPIAALAPAVLFGACLFTPFDSPADGRDPGEANACYRVNLFDGLSEASSAELQDLFACLNLAGAIEPLRPVVEVVVGDTLADGTPTWLRVASLLNRLLADLDLDALIGALEGLVFQDGELALDAMHLGAEWVFGRAYAELRPELVAGADAPGAYLATDGPVLPLLAVARGIADFVLAQDALPRLLDTAAALADDPAVGAAGEALAALVLEGAQTGLLDPFPRDLADTLARLQAFGEGEGYPRDLLARLLLDLAVGTEGGGPAVLPDLLPPLERMLREETNRRIFVDQVARLHEEGLLERLPADLHALTVVDARGDPLLPGDPFDPARVSALEALLRLIEMAHREPCIDLGDGPETVAQFALETLYDITADPQDLDVLTTFQALIDWAADLLGGWGACGLDEDVDLYTPALTVLIESPAIESLIPLLGAVMAPGEPGADRLPELLEVLTAVVRDGFAPTVDALVGATALDPSVADVAAVLGHLAAGEGTVGRDGLMALLDGGAALLAPVDGVDHATAPLAVLVDLGPGLASSQEALDAFEETIARSRTLLHDDLSETARVLDWLPMLPDTLDASPLAVLLSGLDLDEGTLTELLTLAEDPELMAEAARANTAQQERLLGFLGRLLGDGTGERLLGLSRWVAEVLAIVS